MSEEFRLIAPLPSPLMLKTKRPSKLHFGENSISSNFRLKVRDKLFSKSGDLKIKCTAAIDTIYWKSNEESIQGLSERSYNLNLREGGWNSGMRWCGVV